MKYSYPPHAWTLKGLHTLVCTNTKHFLALTFLVVKSLSVILPFMQDLKIGRPSGINECNAPNLTSLWILFRLI